MEIEKNGGDGNTLLHWAIWSFYGEIDSVTILLEHDYNSDINARNSKGETPLHLAAQNQVCSVELVKLLLECGADVKATTPDGNTALHILTMSCKGSNTMIGVADILLRHGSNVNAVNSRGETPLHLAIRNTFLCHDMSLMLIQLLRSYGAEVSVRDATGNNAYQAYCHILNKYNRKMSLVAALLLYQPKERQKYKITPLHMACLFNHFKMVHKWLKVCVDVNATDIYGNSPLYYALIAPGKIDESILMLMFDYGAVITHQAKQLSGTWCIAGYACFNYLDKSSYKILLNVFYQYLAKKLLLWQNEKPITRELKLVMKSTIRKYRTCLTQVTNLVDNHVHKYEDLLTSCYKEVQLMIKTKIGESKVSFLDLLHADKKKTFIYAKNKELIKAFNDKKAMFPIYQGMLDAKIDRDLVRLKLIEKTAAVLSEALGFADPSDEFYERTLSYCSNLEMIYITMTKTTK